MGGLLMFSSLFKSKTKKKIRSVYICLCVDVFCYHIIHKSTQTILLPPPLKRLAPLHLSSAILQMFSYTFFFIYFSTFAWKQSEFITAQNSTAQAFHGYNPLCIMPNIYTEFLAPKTGVTCHIQEIVNKYILGNDGFLTVNIDVIWLKSGSDNMARREKEEKYFDIFENISTRTCISLYSYKYRATNRIVNY